MSIRAWSGLKSVVVCVAMTLVSGCGGGGGGEPVPAPVPPDTSLPLMFDSLGRQLPEADFGRDDPAAAGADGIAFDGGPLANAQVTLADNAGSTRTATSDASGYYRVSIKGLAPPFVVKARRADGTDWVSASASAVKTRGFLTINVNGLTDKVVGYLADASGTGTGGSAGAVSPPTVAANANALAAAKARVVYGLTVPLINAGLDAAGYDPVTAALQAPAALKHETFLRGLVMTKDAAGRTTVIGTLAGSMAALKYPSGVALDGSGNLYVADTHNHVIRKITPDGLSSTLAGSGRAGFADGLGAAAAFRSPAGVAVDAGGNVYVADQYNYAIRKITATGVVTTLAGGGSSDGFADGAGAAAKFSLPQSLAVDASGSVYVADSRNNAIRKITAAGVVSTIDGARFAGSGTPVPAGLTFLTAVAFDAAGNLYVGMQEVGRGGAIRKMTPAGVVSTLYSPGTEAFWFTPIGLAVDAGGTVYVSNANRIDRITSAGAASAFAGDSRFGGEAGSVDGAGASARFAGPVGLAADASGNLFVADPGNNAIRKVTAAGVVSTFAGRRTGLTDGTGTAAMFNEPRGIAVDLAGNVLVADSRNHAIRKISRGAVVTTVAGNGQGGYVNASTGLATFRLPTGVTLDGAGNVYVADCGNHAIRKITPAGQVVTFAGTVDTMVSTMYGFIDGPALTARFQCPSSVAADRNGNLYVSDVGNDSIRKITPAGVVSTFVGRGPASNLSAAEILARGFIDLRGDVALDSNGTVFFPARVPPANLVMYTVFSTAAAGGLTPRSAPYSDASNGGLAVDSQGNLYYGRGAGIFKVTPAGVETEVAGRGAAYVDTSGFAFDRDGNLVISDSGNSAVRIVLP